MERNKIKEDIINTIQNVNDGIDIKSCKCSYYPTRNLVQMAINGEIGEEFRLVKICMTILLKN